MNSDQQRIRGRHRRAISARLFPGRKRRRRRFAMVGFVALTGIAVVGGGLGLAEVGDSDGRTKAFAAVEDTYVIQEYPGVAPGSAAKITAANWDNWHTQAYIKFLVPELTGDTRISSVKVQFTVLDARINKLPRTVELRSVAASDWSEKTMTYRSRPAIGDVVAVANPTRGLTAKLEFDVTRAVQKSGVYSFAMTNPTRNSVASVYSNQSGQRGPQLVVEFSGGGPGPSPTATPTQTTSPKPTTSPSTSPSPTTSQSPLPPSTQTLCGTAFRPEGSGETWQEALSRQDQMFNTLEMHRYYYPGLPPAKWAGSNADRFGRTVAVSFKAPPRDILAGRHDALIGGWFRSMARDRDIYWIYYHEPEDNIRDGMFTAADYRAAWRRLRGLANTAGNPRLRATLTIMEWSVDPYSRRNWKDYFPGSDVVDVIAWDSYNYAREYKRYKAPAELYGRAIEATRSVGLRFAVAETAGDKLATDPSGAGRAAWLRSVVTYLAQQRAVFVSYFDLSGTFNHGTLDYRLRDTESMGVWRSFCS